MVLVDDDCRRGLAVAVHRVQRLLDLQLGPLVRQRAGLLALSRDGVLLVVEAVPEVVLVHRLDPHALVLVDLLLRTLEVLDVLRAREHEVPGGVPRLLHFVDVAVLRGVRDTLIQTLRVREENAPVVDLARLDHLFDRVGTRPWVHVHGGAVEVHLPLCEPSLVVGTGRTDDVQDLPLLVLLIRYVRRVCGDVPAPEVDVTHEVGLVLGVPYRNRLLAAARPDRGAGIGSRVVRLFVHRARRRRDETAVDGDVDRRDGVHAAPGARADARTAVGATRRVDGPAVDLDPAGRSQPSAADARAARTALGIDRGVARNLDADRIGVVLRGELLVVPLSRAYAGRRVSAPCGDDTALDGDATAPAAVLAAADARAVLSALRGHGRIALYEDRTCALPVLAAADACGEGATVRVHGAAGDRDRAAFAVLAAADARAVVAARRVHEAAGDLDRAALVLAAADARAAAVILRAAVGGDVAAGDLYVLALAAVAAADAGRVLAALGFFDRAARDGNAVDAVLAATADARAAGDAARRATRGADGAAGDGDVAGALLVATADAGRAFAGGGGDVAAGDGDVLALARIAAADAGRVGAARGGHLGVVGNGDAVAVLPGAAADARAAVVAFRATRRGDGGVAADGDGPAVARAAVVPVAATDAGRVGASHGGDVRAAVDGDAVAVPLVSAADARAAGGGHRAAIRFDGAAADGDVPAVPPAPLGVAAADAGGVLTALGRDVASVNVDVAAVGPALLSRGAAADARAAKLFYRAALGVDGSAVDVDIAAFAAAVPTVSATDTSRVGAALGGYGAAVDVDVAAVAGAAAADARAAVVAFRATFDLDDAAVDVNGAAALVFIAANGRGVGL